MQAHNPWLPSLLDTVLGTEKKMRIRTGQAGLAVLVMLACAVLLNLLALYGVVEPPGDALVWSAFCMSGMLVFFALVRSGISERWVDPSMAMAQMLFAIACDAVAFVIADHARSLTLPLLAVVLMFGMFGMSRRQVVAVAAYALVLFAGASVYAWITLDTDETLIEFVGYFVMVVIVLTSTTFLTGRLQNMREHLRRQKNQLSAALDKIQLIATRDELTSAVNRRHMLELLRVETQRSDRTGSSLLVAVLDIDHFKRINDTYGHQAGDRALQAFVQVVQSGIRSSDVLARWGGEEFLVMLSDVDPVLGMVCLSRVRVQVAALVHAYSGQEIRMTVSIGMTQYRSGEPVEKTIERADQGLYIAKAQGRDQIVLV